MPMKTNKNSVDMDNSLVVNRRKGRKEKLGKGKRDEIYSDVRRFDFGW